MAFEIRGSIRSAGGRTAEVFELRDSIGSVRAEIWPQWGFNCLRWQVQNKQDRLADIFYVSPDWETDPVPTRSGHPILFPFPGRLRNGSFLLEGKRFSLPLNDSTRQHAIHGFTPRMPWRVVHSDADHESAFLSGEFSLGRDAPDCHSLWPTEFGLTITYRLFTDRLRVEARIENPGTVPLPFGLGYHPYFRLPGLSEPDVGKYLLKTSVAELWESVELLPTGSRVSIPRRIDFREPRLIGPTTLDHAFTIDAPQTEPGRTLQNVAELYSEGSHGRVQILADRVFRELVVFTPPHRQAVAIEPYTCSADAANLAARGIDSGWQVLMPHGLWEAVVEYRWLSTE